MYAYLIGDAALLVVWFVLIFVRRDLHREILVMSLIVGVLSVLTNYFWWTRDWWHPLHIIHARVGPEDFLVGFASGGIMTSLYEEIFRKRLYRGRIKTASPNPLIILLLLANLTGFLFWSLGTTSFAASTAALLIAAGLMFYFRRDLFIAGIASGVLMVLASLVFYFSIFFFYPHWVSATYYLQNLSGILIFGIPAEELIFWFLAGLVFGPFYEYWQRERLRRMTS